jgi:hypothetical protein
VKKFFTLLLLSFNLYSQEFYEIKKRSEDKPIILKVKKLEPHQITVITEGIYDVTIPMNEIESIKEYVPNADRLYHKVILFVDKTYVEGIITLSHTKKIVIEIKGHKDLKVFKTKMVEDIISAEEFNYERSKTPIKASLYSVLLPGWGQQYGNQKSWKGYILTGSFLLSAVATGIYYQQAQDSYSSFQSSLYFDRGAFASHKQQTNVSNLFAITAVGIWSYSIVDAYLFFKPKYNYLPHELMKHEIIFEVGMEKKL